MLVFFACGALFSDALLPTDIIFAVRAVPMIVSPKQQNKESSTAVMEALLQQQRKEHNARSLRDRRGALGGSNQQVCSGAAIVHTRITRLTCP